MKLESLVIADQNAAVNTFPGLVHTARHTMGYIPPYTPEMNPIEQIWKNFESRASTNRSVATLEKVVSSALRYRAP